MILDAGCEIIIDRLEKNGEEVYLVGGAVRNYLLNRKINDYDLATSASSDKVIELFKDFTIYTTGSKFGTVSVVIDNEVYEITSYRKDGNYKDLRHPDGVTFTRSLEEDIKRRDFTINAICYNPKRGFVDLASGMEDIKKKKIRAVGDAEQRLGEDALRILRAIRFASQLAFEIDDDLTRAIEKKRKGILDISKERINTELSKILLSPKPSFAFRFMEKHGLLELISHDLNQMVGFDQRNPHHFLDVFDHTMMVLDSVGPDIILRLAALFHDVGKPGTFFIDEKGQGRFFGHQDLSKKIAADFLREYKFSNSVIDRVTKLIERHMDCGNIYTEKSVKKLMRRMGDDLSRLFELFEKDTLATNCTDLSNIEKARALADDIKANKKAISKRDLAINGRDLIKLGYKQDRFLGQALDRLYEMVLDDDGINKRGKLMELARNILNGGNMKKLFGTDGIRGVANTELSPSLAYKTGRALANRLKASGSDIAIGRDTRRSGDMLLASLTAGILSGGMNVVDLGILPTPAISYLTKKHGYAAGIVISASHNPFEFNGIKIFSKEGFKLPDEVELEIEDMILNSDKIDDYPTGDKLGILKVNNQARVEYKDFLKENLSVDIKGLKIAADCGHGATMTVCKDLFEELGAELVVVNDNTNGMDINDKCGSTDPGVIVKLVKETGSDIGLSFDGDGDRLIAVDEMGQVMDGDHFLAAIAKHLKAKGKLRNNALVGTVMANIGLMEFAEKEDIKVVTTGVGDRYVLEEMLKNDYVIGGEQSGHFIFLDATTTGDGLLSSLKLIETMIEEDKKLSELNSLVTSYPQVLKNAKVKNTNKHAYKDDPVIQEAIKEFEERFKSEGRVLIRPSGTEPLVRVMVEGKDIEELNAESEKLASLIEKRLG